MAVEFEVEEGPTISAAVPKWGPNISVSPRACLVTAIGLSEAEQTAIETASATFNSGVVPPAITISAACTLNFPKSKAGGLSSANILNKIKTEFEFGLVQGLKSHNMLFEFWGRTADDGKTFRFVGMPNVFEIDTTTLTKPWTRTAATRSKIIDISGIAGPDIFTYRVFSEMADHPLWIFGSRVPFEHPTKHRIAHILRRVTAKREFRTMFAFREKSTNKVEGICSMAWEIVHAHNVSYVETVSGSGSSLQVTAVSTGGQPPRPGSGTASDIGEEERRLLKNAFGSGPFLTPESLNVWLNDANHVTVTQEATNAEFDVNFYVTR